MAAAKKKTPKIPKAIGACADLLYNTKEARLKLKKEVDALEEFEKSLKKHIIDNLPKSKSTGVAGNVARVSVIKKPVPTVEDWAKLHKHIKRTGAFDLLQKRVAAKAVEERWEDGKKVPGVGVFEVVTVSLNKI